MWSPLGVSIRKPTARNQLVIHLSDKNALLKVRGHRSKGRALLRACLFITSKAPALVCICQRIGTNLFCTTKSLRLSRKAMACLFAVVLHSEQGAGNANQNGSVILPPYSRSFRPSPISLAFGTEKKYEHKWCWEGEECLSTRLSLAMLRLSGKGVSPTSLQTLLLPPPQKI